MALYLCIGLVQRAMGMMGSWDYRVFVVGPQAVIKQPPAPLFYFFALPDFLCGFM